MKIEKIEIIRSKQYENKGAVLINGESVENLKSFKLTNTIPETEITLRFDTKGIPVTVSWFDGKRY